MKGFKVLGTGLRNSVRAVSVDQIAYARLILDNFIKKCKELNKTYYPQVPWDVRNIEEVLEYYDRAFLEELLAEYAKSAAQPSIKYFCNNIQTIARERDTYRASREAFRKTMAETAKRMHK